MSIHIVYSLISEIKTDRFQKSALLCRNSEEVEGLFLILAEADGTALIKPIVCSELLLPKPSVPLIVELSNETTQLVGKLINSEVLLLIAEKLISSLITPVKQVNRLPMLIGMCMWHFLYF